MFLGTVVRSGAGASQADAPGGVEGVWTRVSGLASWQLVAVFTVGAAVLVRAAVGLARAGDQLVLRTGLSGLFVGTLFLALATSLPEIVTDVSAALADAPDLAVGDLFGSSMANMAILAVIDLRSRGKVWPAVELGHARVAAVAIVLTAVAGLGVLTPRGWSLGWVGLDTLAIALMYIAAVAWFRREQVALHPGPAIGGLQVPTGWAGAELGAGLRTRQTIRRFALAALVILAAAPVVAWVRTLRRFARRWPGASRTWGLGSTPNATGRTSAEMPT